VKVSKLLLPVLAGGLALTLAACGGPVQTPSPGTSASSAAPSGGAGWDINETPHDQLVGGEFVGVTGTAIANWNTYSAAGNNVDVNFLQAPISPTYYDYSGTGTPILNPDYLLSADTTTSPNLVVTMKLNPKAVWNDGEVIGADDWIATWKANNGTDKAYKPASSDGWDQITSIAAGATQQDVVITFKSTYPDWTSIVSTGPLRAEGVNTPAKFNTGWSTYHDEYFTGPFKVSNWDKTSGTVEMVPNDKWWGVKPLLTKITWKQMNSDAMAAAFANQEIDYYDIGADPDGFQQATNAQNSVVRTAAGPTFRQFTFNSASPVLSDVKVRQAIVMGIDRSLIAKSDLAGLPVEPALLNNNFYVLGQDGYVDQAKVTGIDFNVEKAKSTLDEAGWKLNDATGYREKDGKQLDVTFVVLGGVSASENEGLQTQKMLKEIGVKLNLKTIDSENDFGPTLDEHRFDIIAFGWSGTPYPLANIGQIYGGDTKDGKFIPNPSNYAQLEIPKVNELKPLVDVEMDPVKRAELGNQAAQVIWESVHTLPLYQRPMLVGVRAKIANIGALGMARVPKWENIGYVK
jgi:peptide/nickel transport system substrate-binding protein